MGNDESLNSIIKNLGNGSKSPNTETGPKFGEKVILESLRYKGTNNIQLRSVSVDFSHDNNKKK